VIGTSGQDGLFSGRRSNVSEELIVDKDRIEGVAKKVSGGIKEAAGKALGDTKTEADGRAEKAEGRVQNAIGGLKDAARELIGGGDRK
jgi:uncharacterized protein YjbJ (UPF0337 family)